MIQTKNLPTALTGLKPDMEPNAMTKPRVTAPANVIKTAAGNAKSLQQS